jgi:RNA-directed DNA polymerase
MVNGPEDAALSWEAVDWRHHEDNVRRLRQRIFTAAQEGNLATVRNLQKLMLRSWSNTLISVRQATQRNAGRKTAGIDGEVALTWRCRCIVTRHRGDPSRPNGCTYPRRETVRSSARSGFR